MHPGFSLLQHLESKPWITLGLKKNWNDIKNIWKGIKSLISLKTVASGVQSILSLDTVTNLFGIPNTFNNYFESIAKATKKKH